MVLDEQALEVLRSLERNGVSGLVDRVVDSYITTSSDLIGHIQQATETADFAAMITAAHSLKSSSANVGAMSLAGLCEALEEAASAQDELQARDNLSQMTILHPVICDALRFEVHRQAA